MRAKVDKTGVNFPSLQFRQFYLPLVLTICPWGLEDGAKIDRCDFSQQTKINKRHVFYFFLTTPGGSEKNHSFYRMRPRLFYLEKTLE